MIEIISFLNLLFLALMLGLVHAFEADHIAAVTTIASRSKSIRQSSLAGMFWGMGHTASLFAVGTVLLALKLTIPGSFSVSLEYLVGIMLIVLGLDTIRRVRKHKLHIHTHAHGEHEHIHVHAHAESPSHAHAHTSFLVGIFHGLAGSGALVLLAISSSGTFFAGASFIVFFGIGSIFGMALLGAGVGLMIRYARKFERVHTLMQVGTGLLSIVIGALLVYENTRIGLF